MAMSRELKDHLASGVTTICRCWMVRRRDGHALGFTDHDMDLSFEGIAFRASDGLTAKAIEQSTGLAVDNTEAMGILSDPGISEEDILAGRFDGAEVLSWLVNWSAIHQRTLQFRGQIGEIVRVGREFRAELRGLTEALNQPFGLVFQAGCSASLGDARCGVDLDLPGMSAERVIETVERGKVFRFADLNAFADRWFERGRLRVLTGEAAGDVAIIKNDILEDGIRSIETWETLRGGLLQGDRVRLEPGCDKRPGTCRKKFDNIVNFRGFPHLPGEDWLMAYPSSTGDNSGGSLRS